MTKLRAQLAYQVDVNRVLLATTRPKGRREPLLNGAEMDELDLAFEAGLTAEGFAARLIARDKKAPHVVQPIDHGGDDPYGLLREG